MLSLVSYGSSGESDDEDNPENSPNSGSKQQDNEFNDEEWKGDSVDKKKSSSTSIVTSHVKSDETGDQEDLLSKLPPPVSDLKSIPWEQLSKLTYKSRAIRIMAPEIPEDIEEKKEKKLPSKTGSGLLAMLPKPKNSFVAVPKQLKPTSVTSYKPAAVKSKPIPKPKFAALKVPAEDQASDSDGESDANIDFFSLTTPDLPEQNSNSPLLQDIPVPSSHNPLPESAEPPKFSIDTGSRSSQQTQQSSSYDCVTFQQPNDQLELDNEALAALCGSRGLKRKARKDDLKMIDINSSELTPDSYELLTKNLTADQPRPQKNNKDGPTSQQKRKHQIIYLAHQAKEQELELQNTWANNRMSKKQTQAKYGF